MKELAPLCEIFVLQECLREVVMLDQITWKDLDDNLSLHVHGALCCVTRNYFEQGR